MFDAEERAALEAARVGRLATADARGRPHVVPVCFALVGSADGPDRLVTPVDEKPKSAAPAELRRVRDVQANPRVAVVVDRYAEDWDRLGWVQVRGTASVLEPGDAGHGAAVDALRARYAQYAEHALGERPAIAVTPGSVRSWGDLSAIGD
ncbi:MAG: TIGR03668 family PPOX class F420-dependent oxidoreductase [Halobacteriales archaeon]